MPTNLANIAMPLSKKVTTLTPIKLTPPALQLGFTHQAAIGERQTNAVAEQGTQ